jgi:hypothetical protein
VVVVDEWASRTLRDGSAIEDMKSMINGSASALLVKVLEI